MAIPADDGSRKVVDARPVASVTADAAETEAPGEALKVTVTAGIGLPLESLTDTCRGTGKSAPIPADWELP